MAGADGSDNARLTTGLGQTFEIRAVGFKPFSCCRILQSSIQASVLVFSNAKISPASDSFKRLVVTAPSIVCEPPFNQPAPNDAWAAQFSAPYAVAMALFEIEPGPAWSSEAWLHSDAVAGLMAKIELRAHGRQSASGAHHAAIAQLQTVDDQVFEAEVKIALGEAENPLGHQFLEEKFRRLAMPRIGAVRSERLLASVTEIRDCRRSITCSRCSGQKKKPWTPWNSGSATRYAMGGGDVADPNYTGLVARAASCSRLKRTLRMPSATSDARA